MSDGPTVTLREYVDKVLNADQHEYMDRSVKFLTGKIDDLEKLLKERYETSVKATDAAFAASQTAMQTAMVAAALAVQTALLAAKEATAKAEVAMTVRFDAAEHLWTNLTAQVAKLITREDVEFRIAAVVEKFDREVARLTEAGKQRDKKISELELSLSSRLNLSEGRDSGTTEGAQNRRRDATLLVSTISVAIAVVAVVVAVIVAFRG